MLARAYSIRTQPCSFAAVPSTLADLIHDSSRVPIPQILYNDVSPMENHHVAGAFLLLREERYNFLCHVSAKVRRYTVRPARAC